MADPPGGSSRDLRRRRAPVLLLRGVYEAVVAGLRLLLSNWRLGLLELVPALWITAIVHSAVSDVRRWEQGVMVQGERILFERWSAADTVMVASVAATGAVVMLCNTLFALTAVDPDGADIRRAVRVLWARPQSIRGAVAWGAVTGLLRITDLLLPLPTDRFVVLLEVTGVVIAELVLFVSVPARLAGLAQQGLNRRQRAVLAFTTVVLGFVAVLPAFVVGRLATEALAVDWLKPLGAVLFLAALVLQVASVVVVKAVGLAAKLIARAE